MRCCVIIQNIFLWFGDISIYSPWCKCSGINKAVCFSTWEGTAPQDCTWTNPGSKQSPKEDMRAINQYQNFQGGTEKLHFTLDALKHYQRDLELFAKHLDLVLYRHLPLISWAPTQAVTSKLGRSQNAHHGTGQLVRSLHLGLPRKIVKTSLSISFFPNSPMKFSATFCLIFVKSSFREISPFQLLA